jgi:hypothetical protein
MSIHADGALPDSVLRHGHRSDGFSQQHSARTSQGGREWPHHHHRAAVHAWISPQEAATKQLARKANRLWPPPLGAGSRRLPSSGQRNSPSLSHHHGCRRRRRQHRGRQRLQRVSPNRAGNRGCTVSIHSHKKGRVSFGSMSSWTASCSPRWNGVCAARNCTSSSGLRFSVPVYAIKGSILSLLTRRRDLLIHLE